MVAPKGVRTRPTIDRVREALFSILFDVEGITVLDLFAGSGAVGLEACSRGAARCVFVERDRAALAALQKNVAALGVEAEVLSVPVDRALSKLEDPFELIYVDPPWDALDLANPVLERPDLLTEQGRLVLEHRAKDAPPEGQLSLYDQRRYGDTALAFYRRRSS